MDYQHGLYKAGVFRAWCSPHVCPAWEICRAEEVLGCLQILGKRGKSVCRKYTADAYLAALSRLSLAIGEVDNDAECMSIGPPIWPHLSLGAG